MDNATDKTTIVKNLALNGDFNNVELKYGKNAGVKARAWVRFVKFTSMMLKWFIGREEVAGTD